MATLNTCEDLIVSMIVCLKHFVAVIFCVIHENSDLLKTLYYCFKAFRNAVLKNAQQLPQSAVTFSLQSSQLTMYHNQLN